MTEHDQLEAELLSFSPRDLSPETKQRIAIELDSQPAVKRNHPPWRLRRIASIAAGALAVIVVVVLWSSSDQNAMKKPETPAASVQPLMSSAFDATLPSVWAYRSAFTQSPQALDALLDKHAVRIPETKSERAPDYVFVRFDSKLNALTGEL